MKEHFVTLNDEQRQTLTNFTRTGTHPAQAITHARILLQADTNGPEDTDERIAENLGIEKYRVFIGSLPSKGHLVEVDPVRLYRSN